MPQVTQYDRFPRWEYLKYPPVVIITEDGNIIVEEENKGDINIDDRRRPKGKVIESQRGYPPDRSTPKAQF
jgi:hypothetical protein